MVTLHEREAGSPTPVVSSISKDTNRTLPQPDTVSDAQTLIRIELQRREREVTVVPKYSDPETRSVRPNRLGYTGHTPRSRPIPKLRAPRPEDVEPLETAFTAPGGGAVEARRKQGKAPRDAAEEFMVGKTKKGYVVGSQNFPRETRSKAHRGIPGYSGFSSRLGPDETSRDILSDHSNNNNNNYGNGNDFNSNNNNTNNGYNNNNNGYSNDNNGYSNGNNGYNNGYNGSDNGLMKSRRDRDEAERMAASRRPDLSKSGDAPAPPSARYYVPSLTLPSNNGNGKESENAIGGNSRNFSGTNGAGNGQMTGGNASGSGSGSISATSEARYHVPGYKGHVRGEGFKFGNTFGDTTRHQLTKPEMQSEAYQPPTARVHMGRSSEHLSGQYFKLPNKLGAINQYGAAQSANFAVVHPDGTAGSVTSNKNITREAPPEPVVYRPWTSRKPLKTLPPPLDDTLGTTEGLDTMALTPRPPTVKIEADSQEDQMRRTAIGVVRIKRNEERNRTSIVNDIAGKKDDRVQQAMEATFEARRRHLHALDLDAKPALKSRKVKEGEAKARSTPKFDRQFSPKSTGHIPGYAGHVNKQQVNFGKTLAARSKKNYADPFGVGFGTRSGRDDIGLTTTHRRGPAELIASQKLTARGKKEASFVDDPKMLEQFPTPAEAFKVGRTHVPLDPALHTDVKHNVITNGAGGYPRAKKEPPEQTEQRYHVPGYTGHVEKVKFKFGNSYSDTTQHVLTKDGMPEERSVPFNAAKGDARPDYGFLKLTNKIEGKNPANLTRRPTDLSGSYRGHRSTVINPRVRITRSNTNA